MLFSAYKISSLRCFLMLFSAFWCFLVLFSVFLYLWNLIVKKKGFKNCPDNLNYNTTININSFRNKFEMLQEVIENSIDVLLISETKLDASFPSSQFILDGLTTPYRLDRTQYEGGIVLFMREGIPSKLLNADTSIGIENLLVEISLWSKKWLIWGSYNPHLNSIQNHLVQLSKKFDFYSSKYENFIVLGDFIAEMINTHTEEFCSVYNFESLIKDPACFKNPEKPTTTDHILTNHPRCFQHSGVYKTGLSDFHRLTLTVLKVYHSKENPKII